ncbi:phytase [Sphingobium nicotianae]|uniref:Phytase n=1 Tax=Sphingobium nicotianae TaxID=2782607 RepID=A0A9X1DE87_9SPHN|nr:phytase [Sphingobium nicotianae]MBT2188317.1 phytase [Sphingobium nicotianae]
MSLHPVSMLASILGLFAAMPSGAQPVETATIPAVRETAPVASPGDSADDPAVWRNPADPAKSLIVGTDKSWGLNVYDLSGKLVASAPAGRVNNVDLRADVLIGGREAVLVAATDRSDDPHGKIALYALEASPAGLRHLAHVPVASDGVGDVYGFCLWRYAADRVFAFIAFNNGDVRQYALDLSGSAPSATLVRDVKLGSRTEGCVVDDRTGLLYVGEERRAIWRIDAAPDSKAPPTMFAAVDGVRLIPDIEGVTIIPQGARGGLLLASSQNDNAYVAYDLESGRYVRRFRVTGSGPVDGVTDTDGLEFAPGNFSAPFEKGFLIVQDGDNAPDNQNFKLVPGKALKTLLGLK